MKCLLVLLCLASAALASTSGGGGGSVGSLPGSGTAVPPPTAMPGVGVKTVRPGESHDNGDGVVTNDPTAGGNIRVDPKIGDDGTFTTVDFKNDSIGTASGYELGDVVNVSSGAEATVSMAGGTVNLTGSNAVATVTNSGAEGGAKVRVTFPGGGYTFVDPGETVTSGS